MLRLLARVGLMARPARTSLDRPVHMHKVKVVVAVAKIRQCLRALVSHGVCLVTAEA